MKGFSIGISLRQLCRLNNNKFSNLALMVEGENFPSLSEILDLFAEPMITILPKFCP